MVAMVFWPTLGGTNCRSFVLAGAEQAEGRRAVGGGIMGKTPHGQAIGVGLSSRGATVKIIPKAKWLTARRENFPMNKPPGNAADHPRIATGPVRTNPERFIRILLADDDLYARELHAGVLIRSGYQVDTAGDGVEAWQVLKEEAFDLLIIEQHMPWVTGLELIHKLRTEAKTLPVILLSDQLPKAELEQHPECQIQAMLQKPCPLEALLSTVRHVLGESQSGWGKDPMADS